MMTFDEVWKTLPMPANYFAMDDAYKLRWQGVVEAAFRTGLFEGTYKSGSAKTADSKRLSDLEAAVAEIQEAMQSQIEIKRELHRTRVHALTDELDARSKHAEEIAELKKEMADADRHHKDVCALHAQDLRDRDARISQLCENELRLKAELRDISRALDDPRVDNTITAVDAIKNLRAALKVIYTWCCYPDDFDFGKTKAACLFALRGSRQ